LPLSFETGSPGQIYSPGREQALVIFGVNRRGGVNNDFPAAFAMPVSIRENTYW
jgi:hypothetical protein